MLNLLRDKITLYRYIYPQLSDFEKDNQKENFKIEYTHDSTAIEGNTLTLAETKIILEEHYAPRDAKLREIDEIRNHADAFDYMIKPVKEKLPLSEDIIKNIHEKVMPMTGAGGIYRNCAIYIKGAIHVPPNPRIVYQEMGNYIYKIHHNTFQDSLEKAAFVHAEFTKIHPFIDGNGRTARLLMNYQLLSDGFPPVSIKNQNRKKYFETLEEYSVNNNLKPFYKLLYENMHREVDNFLKMYENYIDLEKIKNIDTDLYKIAKNHYAKDKKAINLSM